MSPATGALRGASRRLIPSVMGRRGLSYRGGKSRGQPPEKSSKPPSAVPPPAASATPAQPKASPAPAEAKPPTAQPTQPPPQATAAEAPKAAAASPSSASSARPEGSSSTGVAAQPAEGGGGGTMLLLGAGLLGAGAAAYMYFDTSMAPKVSPAPDVQLSLDEPVSYPPQEKQTGDDPETVVTDVGSTSSSPPEADSLGADGAHKTSESEATVTAEAMSEEDTAATPPAQQDLKPESVEEAEEEAAMVAASEEQQQQAQLVTGILNEVLAEPFSSPGGSEVDDEMDFKQAVFLQLGLDPKALDAPGLVSAAISSGYGASDGKAFQAAHRQAVSDSEIFAKNLEDVKANLDAKIEAEKAQAAAARAEVAVIQAEAKKQRQDLLSDKEAELKKQEQYLSMTSAKALAKERADRVKVLNTLREQLNVMGKVMDKKQEETLLGCQLHRLSIATFALQKALDEGQPFASQVEDLKASAPGDELVEAVARSLDPSMASAGIPTRVQLIDRFGPVTASAAELCLLPEGGGGILAVGLSAIAAKLRISETEAERVGLAGGGIMAATARARAKLAAGQLLAAAEELEEAVKGSSASAVVADWAAAAKARAVADQAVAVIQAHATTVAASLAG